MSRERVGYSQRSMRATSIASIACIATLTIRDVDDGLRTRLRVRAARHGRSMEAEVRAILREALAKPAASEGLGTRIHQRFEVIGGVDVEQPDRPDRPRSAQLPP
jgi:plasmid stability protein